MYTYMANVRIHTHAHTHTQTSCVSICKDCIHTHMQAHIHVFDCARAVVWCAHDTSKNIMCEYNPPKNGEIALRPNTRVVKCKYYISQKQIGFKYNIHSYRILLTLIFNLTARL